MERIDYLATADAAALLGAPMSVVRGWIAGVSCAEPVSPADFRTQDAAGRAGELMTDCEFLSEAVRVNAGDDGNDDAVINPVAHAAARTDEILAVHGDDVPAHVLRALGEIRDVLGRMPVW